MVTQRERLKERGLSQISVWLPDESVVQIKSMAERLGLSLPKLIERALLAYQPDMTGADGGMDRLQASSLEARLSRVEARLTAMDALPSRVVAAPTSYPAPARAGAVITLPAAPSGGERGAMAALRDPVIIELHKQGLMHREIQVELCRRGIFAKGKDGNPSPISTGLISTILKKAGLGNAALATD